MMISPRLLGSIAALALALAWQTLPGVATALQIVGYIALGTAGFLVSVIWFVDFYTKKDLCKPGPNIGHTAEIVDGVVPENVLSDLDKIANPEGLSALWKQEIQDKNNSLAVLLTGVTGYVGRAFLFQLLREIALAEKDGKKLGHKVYVMARAKARKNLSAAQRLEQIRDDPMFAPYKKQWDDVVVAAESGDLQDDKCGMSEETLKQLEKAKITHVVHCAADVNFNRPLPDSAGINISPALQLQALAAQWPTCNRFVHCSTAFVNPGHGTDENPMPEALFDLGEYDPQDLYDSMRGDQKLALKVKEEFGFPNNYVLTKCVAEHLVTRHNKSEQVELKIVRPAIVGPAWLLPRQGWNGDRPSTISGVFLLWGCRVVRLAPLTRNKPMPVVPVDVVANGIMHAMVVAPAKKTSEDTFSVTYRNLIWSHKSPKKFVDGIQMARENMQAAQLMNHFSSIETALCYLLLDIVDKFPSSFDILHLIFNLGPLYLLQFVCWSLKTLHIHTVLEKVPLIKLFNFSDMLNLYRPYIGREFKFESSMDVPPSLDVHRYSSGLLVATRDFMHNMFPGTVPELNVVDLLPKGRLDLLWALTQPCRSFKDRIAMYFACKILRCSCESMQLDFISVQGICRVMLELEKNISEKKCCIVLTPNHKSVLDCILIKYISFCLASVGVDITTVLKKKELDDPALSKKVGQVKSTSDRHPTFAAFLEESPSSDDRPKKLDTGAMDKLIKNGGDTDFTFVPVSLSYKSVTESEILLDAIKNSSDIGFLGMLSLYWHMCVLKNGKSAAFGGIRIKFGTPCQVKSNSNAETTAASLEKELKRITA